MNLDNFFVKGGIECHSIGELRPSLVRRVGTCFISSYLNKTNNKALVTGVKYFRPHPEPNDDVFSDVYTGEITIPLDGKTITIGNRDYDTSMVMKNITDPVEEIGMKL